jgi:hypothetical protein
MSWPILGLPFVDWAESERFERLVQGDHAMADAMRVSWFNSAYTNVE